MIQKLRKMNESLPGVMLGIIIYGIVCEIIGLFFVKNAVRYSVGLWLGIMLALFMIFHMAWSLSHAVSFEQGGAQKFVQKHNLVRYGVIVVLFFLILITEIANPLYVFLGVMGLKVGAYLQPFTHKLIVKIWGE